MDVVTLALARKYADNKIQDLGTIQRLAGRVETVEDLENIENPQIGDVYIVGTKEQENSEYIFVGDEWEELGPLFDTSSFADATYTYNALANRPTFGQTKDLIESEINGNQDTRFLRYIGHYTSEDTFPFAGQESATLVQTNPYTYTSDLRNPNFNIDDIRAIVKEPYFIGTYVSPTEYSLVGFNSPDQLQNIRFLPDIDETSGNGKPRVSSQVIVAMEFSASQDPDIYLYSLRSSATSSRFNNSTKDDMCYYIKYSDSKMERDTPQRVYNDARIFIQSAPNICCNVTGRIFNYLEDDYGCLKIASYNYPYRFISEHKTQMVLQFANNFVYDVGMALLKFDENCQPVWFTTEGECTVNDILSFGEDGDYRRFSGEAWVPMGMQSADIKEYVNTTINETLEPIDEMLDVIINGE